MIMEEHMELDAVQEKYCQVCKYYDPEKNPDVQQLKDIINRLKAKDNTKNYQIEKLFEELLEEAKGYCEDENGWTSFDVYMKDYRKQLHNILKRTE